MDAKKVFLQVEGDAYFERYLQSAGISKGTNTLSEFLERNPNIAAPGKSVLEIGCSDGRNLIYLAQNFELKGFGIEPSEKAITYGQEMLRSGGISNVELLRGTSDELPFEDNSMDFVILGFCMYVVDRRYLLKTAAEVDRVLKRGGLLLIEDFDVPHPFQRPNKHNKDIYTYKYDYTSLFLGDPSYSLIEKKSYSLIEKNLIEKECYSISSYAFDPRVQERVSCCILYKEMLEDVYHFVD